MTRSAKALLADVQSRVEHKSPGYESWFDRLDTDAQKELIVVREAFQRGELGSKAAVARAVISAAKDRGWKVAKEKQVCMWLVQQKD